LPLPEEAKLPLFQSRLSFMNGALKHCAEGFAPPNVALVQLFIASRHEAEARSALEAAIDAARARSDAVAVTRLLSMRDLWADSAQGYEKIATLYELERRYGKGWFTNRRIQQCAAYFDRAAAVSPQAAVAAYSLGNDQRLEAATRELVEVMRRWKLFDATSDVLDLGCGFGRCLELVAPLVHSISGLDVSEGMLRLAAERTSRFTNVRVVRGSGRDLSEIRDRRFHLIVAVDSFPYLVKAGVAERHLSDCAGLLIEEGHLLIFNYSYRGGVEADRVSVRRASQQHGFALLRDGTRDLELWDGVAFLMQKRPKGA
jgi:cyclopropane fatty-acyl-phospholipid synthase-like methyltransferase